MKRLTLVIATITAASALLSPSHAAAQSDTEYSHFSFNSSSQIPGPDESPYKIDDVLYGAYMPYTRYEAEASEATLGGGATEKYSDVKNSDWKEMQRNIATQASNRRYTELPTAGSYVEWKASRSGNAVTLRFNIQSSEGKPLRDLYGSLDFYVNDVKVKTIDVNTHWAYQYFSAPNGNYDNSHNASDSYIESAFPAFAFDEVGFLLETSIQIGDKIKIQSTGNNGHIYGVDFIEVEKVKKVECPSGYARFDGGNLQDFINSHTNIYIPEGKYELGEKINFNGKNIIGAGIFYTTLHFTSGSVGGGGIRCGGGELAHIHLTSNLTSRWSQAADYKGLEAGPWNLFAHDLWVQHFECGAWFENGNNIKIVNCRLRDNYADGLNFCKTNNSTVYNCSVRNNGDDGLAMWNHNENANNGDEKNNTFCYNTVELGWRAGMLGVFGGDGHKVYNNYVIDAICSAGIRVNTDFPGYKFNNTNLIEFSNNIIIGCGTQQDIFGNDTPKYNIDGSGKLPPVFINGSDGTVRNVTFTNNTIYQSQIDYDIVFRNSYDNITIDGKTYNSSSNGGFGIKQGNSDSDIPAFPPVDDSEETTTTPAPVDFDLELAGIKWSFDGAYTDIPQGSEIPFTVLVKNNSKVPIPADFKVTVGLTVGGVNLYSKLDGFEAGTAKELTFKYTANTAGGVKATATISCRGTDINLANNTREKQFNVKEAEKTINRDYTPTTGGWNLVITDLSWENLSRSDGKILENDHLVFTAHVANAGDQATPNEKHGVQFRVDGKDYGAGFVTWCDEYNEPLGARQTTDLRANSGGQNGSSEKREYHIAEKGLHSVTVYFDSGSFNGIQKTFSLPTVPYEGVTYLAQADVTEPDGWNETTTNIVEPMTITTASADNSIYDTYGRYRGTDLEALPAGIYITAGHKIAKTH